VMAVTNDDDFKDKQGYHDEDPNNDDFRHKRDRDDHKKDRDGYKKDYDEQQETDDDQKGGQQEVNIVSRTLKNQAVRFASTHNLDSAAAARLQGTSDDVAREVLEQGIGRRVRNPSAYVTRMVKQKEKEARHSTEEDVEEGDGNYHGEDGRDDGGYAGDGNYHGEDGRDDGGYAGDGNYHGEDGRDDGGYAVDGNYCGEDFKDDGGYADDDSYRGKGGEDEGGYADGGKYDEDTKDCTQHTEGTGEGKDGEQADKAHTGEDGEQEAGEDEDWREYDDEEWPAESWGEGWSDGY
jgi:hypothetical protein